MLLFTFSSFVFIIVMPDWDWHRIHWADHINYLTSSSHSNSYNRFLVDFRYSKWASFQIQLLRIEPVIILAWYASMGSWTCPGLWHKPPVFISGVDFLKRWMLKGRSRLLHQAECRTQKVWSQYNDLQLGSKISWMILKLHKKSFIHMVGIKVRRDYRMPPKWALWSIIMPYLGWYHGILWIEQRSFCSMK